MSNNSDDDPLFELLMLFVAGCVITVASLIYTVVKALTAATDRQQETADEQFIGKEDDPWRK